MMQTRYKFLPLNFACFVKNTVAQKSFISIHHTIGSLAGPELHHLSVATLRLPSVPGRNRWVGVCVCLAKFTLPASTAQSNIFIHHDSLEGSSIHIADSDEFRLLLAHVTNEAHRATLTKWFVLDENRQPTQYVLQPVR